MRIRSTAIGDLYIVDTDVHFDSRGAFARFYCDKELSDLLGGRNIVQVNYSCTSAVGALRGMHFQYPPYAEMKMVRCVQGRVWDVAVDLRQDSPTFLRWHGEELTTENSRMMVIPEGFAHGFQVLERDSALLYLHTDIYTPSAEGGVRYDDPALGIRWPIDVSDLSSRDGSHPLIADDYQGMTV
jgi:dTDP-4-dehydrorhamnose 3,5-epimerase